MCTLMPSKNWRNSCSNASNFSGCIFEEVDFNSHTFKKFCYLTFRSVKNILKSRLAANADRIEIMNVQTRNQYPQFLAVFFPRGFSLKGLLYYIKYQSFCPVVLIGSPHPLPRKRMCPLLKTEVGGETHSLAG